MYYMYILVTTFHDGHTWKRKKKNLYKKKEEKKLLTHPDINVTCFYTIKSSLLKKGEREWTSYDCKPEVSTRSLFFFKFFFTKNKKILNTCLNCSPLVIMSYCVKEDIKIINTIIPLLAPVRVPDQTCSFHVDTSCKFSGYRQK